MFPRAKIVITTAVSNQRFCVFHIAGQRLLSADWAALAARQKCGGLQKVSAPQQKNTDRIHPLLWGAARAGLLGSAYRESNEEVRFWPISPRCGRTTSRSKRSGSAT